MEGTATEEKEEAEPITLHAAVLKMTQCSLLAYKQPELVGNGCLELRRIYMYVPPA